MNVKQMKTEELIPYDNNPRFNEGAVDKVAESIKEFGFKVPIIIDSSNVIVTGHTRLMAANKLGMEQVPVIVADDLSDSQIKAFRIADNKVAEFSEWDFDKLEIELEGLANSDIDMELDLLGFDDFIEPEDDLEAEEDEFEIEVPKEPKSKIGDVYQLGKHRLMCGDSTNDDDVKKLLKNEKVEMVFTDPPYLMNFTGSVHADGSKSHNSSYGTIKNDSMSKKDGDEFIYKIIRVIKENTIGAYYICFYRLGLDYVFRALERNNNKYRALIIWDKGNHTLSNSDYMSKYEPIVYGWIDEHNFYGEKAEFDIWQIPRTKHNDLHPTMKPLDLVERAVKNSSRTGEKVLDLFGGSGSTLIACEQLKRINYSMELDPKYVDVIINRWEEYTGEEAVLING